jgi:hypothetical protein
MAAKFPISGQKDGFPEACFETNHSTRIAYIIFIIILSLAILFAIIFFVFILGTLAKHLGLPIPLVIAVYVLLCIFCIHWAWKIICYSLRFCIIYYPEYLQVGRGLVRCTFPYEDIDIIAMNVTNKISSVNIICGGTKARVFLVFTQTIECIDLLSHHCNNAIIIDTTGRVHLPQNPNNSAKTISSLKRHFKEKILMNLFCTFCFGSIAIWLTVQCLPKWWIGKFQLDKNECRLIEIIVSMYAISVVNIWLAWKSWKTFSYIRDKQKNIDIMGDPLQ